MKRILLVTIAALSLLVLSVTAFAEPEGAWPGVDETVVERVAAEHGREAKSCGLGLEGDAQLFMFLMAGVVGGFALGYYYRKTFSEGRRNTEGGTVGG